MTWTLPELDSQSSGVIRIPFEADVPLSRRIARIIDCPAMQRLKRISQLGLVSAVYPGATHSRFEHSLGVYRLACEVLRHFTRSDARFCKFVAPEDAELFLVACLLHDVGHWPYCHPIEDIGLPEIPAHEQLARELICDGELADAIAGDWSIDPAQVANFLFPAPGSLSPPQRLLKSFMDGPVDVDKMDYLQRDSLHSGVPYGNNFDVGRLIKAFCADYECAKIAITNKGKTAAEMMVFARYVMFSEVYWHHAVRSATTMLQRLVFHFSHESEPSDWLKMSDASFQVSLMEKCNSDSELRQLSEGLFGNSRRLYKRIGQFNFVEQPEIHRSLRGKSYEDLLRISQELSQRLNSKFGCELGGNDLLLDAPPAKLEVQFDVEVRQKDGCFTKLAELSPVVNTLATDQFDNYVKQVRVFANPEKVPAMKIVSSPELAALLGESIATLH